MDVNKGRIFYQESEGFVRIKIKHNDTRLAAFFLLIVITACFTVILLIFDTLGFAFPTGTPATVLGWILAEIAVAFKAMVAFELARATLWNVAGSEVIEVKEGVFTYYVRAIGIGLKYVYPVNDIKKIEEYEYAESKDLIYMIGTEIGIGGKSLRLFAGKRKLYFGRCLTMEDSEAVMKLLKETIKNI